MALNIDVVKEKIEDVLDEMTCRGFVITNVGVNLMDKAQPTLEVNFEKPRFEKPMEANE